MPLWSLFSGMPHSGGRSARRWVGAFAVLVAVLAPPSRAAEPVDPWQSPIAPDRPGAATSPSVLDRGVFQIETAFESQTVRPVDAPDARTEDFPTLLRLGVGHRVELRLESNTVSVAEAVTGLADMSIEAKWLALDQPNGAVPSVGFMPAVSLPTGSSQFTAGKVQASLAGLFEWTLHSGTSLTLDANASHAVEESDAPYEWQLGSQAAFQIPLRREWAVGGDAFVTAPLVDGSSAPWGLDAGVEYYPNPETQLDVTLIQTMTEPGTTTAVQLGFSRRFGAERTQQ